MNKPVLRIAPPYDDASLKAIYEGFEKLCGRKIEFEVIPDDTLIGGFIAMIDGQVYDASLSLAPFKNASFSDFRNDMSISDFEPESVGAFIRRKIESTEISPSVYEYGTVKSCSDDVVQIEGLSGTHYGEFLELEGGVFALALDLHLNGVGAVLLGGGDAVSTGSSVRATGRVADICVGDKLLGRVIDPVGRPLDGMELSVSEYRHIESPAPKIFDRSPVKAPLETGILSIDSMIPIGRGQRELIIGDRQTGKTSIALSTILNQKSTGVLCVYCAIGQKASTVASFVHTLKEAGAMRNTVVVSATAADSAAMQYIAPYAACAVAEHFMYAGKDVLIIYDDLSKHATAYRAMSLLLRRPSGREAYPGDIFYLHSRLLERAAKLSDALGGGSMTALPIVETLAGDISAYIPTNVISITDGQIYLESELFSAGVRPAINVGLSVSRVGRSAQSKAMKKVSSRLRLELAQYRDMAVFAQFGADIDASTAAMLNSGIRLTELLKQSADELFDLSEQVSLLAAFSHGVFANVDVKDVARVKRELLEFLKSDSGAILSAVNDTGDLTDEHKDLLLKAMDRFLKPRGGEVDV